MRFNAHAQDHHKMLLCTKNAVALLCTKHQEM